MQKEILGLTATGVPIPPSPATAYRPYVVNGKWKCPWSESKMKIPAIGICRASVHVPPLKE